MLILTAAVSLMLAQAAQPAAAPAAPPPAAAKAEKPKKARRVCQDEVPMGSLIGKRVCRSQEEIEAAERNSQQNLRDVNDYMARCGGRPC